MTMNGDTMNDTGSKWALIDDEIQLAQERFKVHERIICNFSTACGLCTIVAALAAGEGMSPSESGTAVAELQHSLNLDRENWCAGFSEALGDRRTRNGHLRRLGVLYLLRRAVRDFV